MKSELPLWETTLLMPTNYQATNDHRAPKAGVLVNRVIMTKSDQKTATGKASRGRAKKINFKPSDDITGITISSPSHNFISDVHSQSP